MTGAKARPVALSLALALAGGVSAPAALRGQPAASPQRAFEDTLQEAKEGMERLLKRYPRRADLESVKRQLGRVEEWTRGGRWPSAWQVRSLSFGVIAAREIEPLDLPLARRLEALSYYLNNLPRSPGAAAKLGRLAPERAP